MAAPSRPPAETTPSDDWADQAADTVIKVVDTVRDKTTGPVLTVARAIVYGLIGVFAGLVALILITIILVRVLDVALPGPVWQAHLVIGVVFTIGGLLAWRRRYAPEAS